MSLFSRVHHGESWRRPSLMEPKPKDGLSVLPATSTTEPASNKLRTIISARTSQYPPCTLPLPGLDAVLSLQAHNSNLCSSRTSEGPGCLLLKLLLLCLLQTLLCCCSASRCFRLRILALLGFSSLSFSWWPRASQVLFSITSAKTPYAAPAASAPQTSLGALAPSAVYHTHTSLSLWAWGKLMWAHKCKNIQQTVLDQPPNQQWKVHQPVCQISHLYEPCLSSEASCLSSGIV